MRAIGPKPGRNAKKVGLLESPNSGRFDCATNCPPVWRFRIRNGPPTTFDTWNRGVTFQEPRSKEGRVIPVLQSIPVLNSPSVMRVTATESFGSMVEVSGIL